MKFFIRTFGCQMNENDSFLIEELLVDNGYEVTESVDLADIIIINTCCVRESAENKALGYLGSLKHLYEMDRSRIIILCGCMMQQSKVAENIHKRYPFVRIILGTYSVANLPEYLKRAKNSRETIIDTEERYDSKKLKHIPNSSSSLPTDNNYRAQINISYGCNNFCSYCIVPYVRGRERSRVPDDILAEIKMLANQGVREIQLLGQNVNSYGKDLPTAQGCDFAALLQRIHQIEGIQRIRYMTSHPRDFSFQLVDIISSLPKVCKHFHLPLQSGSDTILKQMNRGYTTGDYRALLAHIREKEPYAVITTDLIVGFPGETDDFFNETLDFVKQCCFDAAYTFLYSRRSGTPAANMPNQVADTIKKERLQKLMDMQNAISLQKNQEMVGKRYLVMFEGVSKQNKCMLTGRTEGNKIVIFSAPKNRQIIPGDVIETEITTAQTWNLMGKVL